jgi:hypothetical protein
MIAQPKSPLRYSQAETVAKRLVTRWSAITGHKPPVMKDEAWADVVQAVLRWAEVERAAEPQEKRNG